MRAIRNLMVILIFLGLPVAVLSQEQVTQEAGADNAPHHTELERLTVYAQPLADSGLDSTQPVEVLAGEYLNDRRGTTLGETLQQEPGIHSTYFGPGAGRPVIRGLGGSRVSILESGIGTLDASALSPDHAAAVEPLLVDQIEVLKGPATLLYGSSAVGGVVNVIDGRIHETPLDTPLTGRVELRGNTVADERAGVARLEGGNGLLSWHLDGFVRDTGDAEIPGFALTPEKRAELDPEARAELQRGTLENSFVETYGGTGGLSVGGDWGFFGVAFQRYDSEYGVPAELEAEEEEPEGMEAGEEEGGVSIDLRRNRVDVRAGLFTPMAGIEKVTFKLGHNDYRHDELEGAEIGTRFDIDATEWRVEAKHAPFGNLRGVIGGQGKNEDLLATGAEAFLPESETESLGVFVLEEWSLGDWRLNAGARVEDTEVTNRVTGQTRDFDLVSTSAGALWQVSEQWQLSANWSRSERAATQEELFADGVHVAIQTFEIGDAALGEETANAFDFTIHKHLGALHAKANVFVNVIDEFIFLDNTGAVEDGFPVRIWRQGDADFVGAEIELGWRWQTGLGEFNWIATFDTVDGELDAGGQLPRISPTRYGTEVDWHYADWRARLGYQRVTDVDDVAAFETRTDGYNMIDVDLAYRFTLDGSDWEVFLKGENLADETARVHTSFLKDFAPLPGINLGFGVRTAF